MTEQGIRRRAGRPSASEAEFKRRSLIHTALEEFARVGFHGASLREIAEKAGVSSRTLYNHYPDKLALFEACLEFSGRQIQPVIPELNGDLQARLTTYTIAIQRHLSEPQAHQMASLIYREGAGFDALRTIARTQFERHQVAPVARLLEASGIPAERAVILATQYVAMAFGEWQRRLLFGGPTMTEREMDEQARLVTDIFLNGVNNTRTNTP